MWPVSWGHQCCESPAAFGCVVVMCVVGWGRSDCLIIPNFIRILHHTSRHFGITMQAQRAPDIRFHGVSDGSKR